MATPQALARAQACAENSLNGVAGRRAVGSARARRTAPQFRSPSVGLHFRSVPDRFLIDAYGTDDDAVRVGVRWLVAYAREHAMATAAILVPGISNAENLESSLGNLGTKLYRDRQAYVDGVTISLLTPRGGGLGAHARGPYLAVWADDAMVAKIERVSPPAICAIPWSEQDLRVWKAAWSPADPRAGTSAGPAPTISNPVVRVAMEGLTIRVNLSSALSHPSDKEAAGSTLKTLVGGGEQFEPAEIQAWAVANGWKQEDAKRLAEMAQALQNGRRVQAGSADAAMLERWREQARS